MSGSEGTAIDGDLNAQASPAAGTLQREILLARQKRRVRMRLVAMLCGVPILALMVAGAFSLTQAVDVVVSTTDALDDVQGNRQIGATIEVVEGVGLVVEDKVYSLSDVVTVRAQASGYFSQDVRLEAASDSYVEVRLEPKPAMVVFALSNAAIPSLASTRWLIDDEPAGRGAQLTLSLPAGDYRVTADNPYYELLERSITLQRDEQKDVAVMLAPVGGLVALNTNPKNATILLDGKPIDAGSTIRAESPDKLPGMTVAGGRYAVQISAPGYATVSEEIEITRHAPTVQRDYRLIHNPAHLSFAVSPADGLLTLDGRAIDLTASSLSVSAAQEHVLIYERSGYHTLKRRVTLAPGARQQVDLHLQKNVGNVSVVSSPPGEVQVDGRVVGRTPMQLQLPAIPHEITVSLAGYHPITKVVTPADTAGQLVDVKLLTELEYRLANMPGQYSNAAGMRMLRFVPNDQLQLGAPRAEKGQRANEQVRQVRLSKALYVSQTEVTAQQYSRFRALSAPSNLPQTDVSWFQAAQFCNWLSEQEGLLPVYRFSNGRYQGADINRDGYRLPTEAEWEWLARKAGRRQATRFTWGDEYTIPTGSANIADEQAKGLVALYVPRYDDGYAGLAPVGSFGLAPSGLADLSGNASEWVHDFYAIAPASGSQVSSDPSGPSFGDGHVVKGSSWRSGTPTTLRAAYRDNAVQARDDLGFRVARYVYGAE